MKRTEFAAASALTAAGIAGGVFATALAAIYPEATKMLLWAGLFVAVISAGIAVVLAFGRARRSSAHLGRRYSAISDISYDEKSSKLFIRFLSGQQYVYLGIPKQIHRSLLDAESKGRFFQSRIRDRYPFERRGSWKRT